MPVPRRVSAFTKTGCPVPASWRIIRRFHRLSARRGLVAYALRTRPPLSPIPKDRIPCDLHVLGLPPAFILSQDQTLRCNIALLLLFRLKGLSCLVFPQPTTTKTTASRRTQRQSAAVLASRCHRTPANITTNLSPLPSFAGAKVQPFTLTTSTFFKKNSKNNSTR